MAWALVALWTGFSFVGYFTPVHTLLDESIAVMLGPWEAFWILFYALATYGNAGWMREQVCKYMCPYARFQSAMFDHSTLIITYDKQRGEPRGPRVKSAEIAATDSARSASGDCIDCSLCVQVCPTGIDIRDGLQYECIGCAACIDACNSVMKKIDLPSGLIRYSTEHAMSHQLSAQQIRQHVLRPRVLMYAALLAVIVTVFFSTLMTRTPLKLDVIRDRGALGREGENGAIENVYRLQIMNTAEAAHHYRITVAGIPSVRLLTTDEVVLGPTESRAVPVRVQVEHGHGKHGSNPIAFTLTALDDAHLHVEENAVFFVPK